MRRFFWKIALVPNYRPYRYYYMWRNFIYLYIRNFRTYILHNDYWYGRFLGHHHPPFFYQDGHL